MFFNLIIFCAKSKWNSRVAINTFLHSRLLPLASTFSLHSSLLVVLTPYTVHVLCDVMGQEKKQRIKNTKKCILIKCHTNATRNVRTVWYFIARLWRVWSPTESPLGESTKMHIQMEKTKTYSLLRVQTYVYFILYIRTETVKVFFFWFPFEWRN